MAYSREVLYLFKLTVRAKIIIQINLIYEYIQLINFKTLCFFGFNLTKNLYSLSHVLILTLYKQPDPREETRSILVFFFKERR